MGAVLKFLGGLGLGSLNGVLSILTAGMNGALSLAMSAMNAMTQYHQESIEFARNMGMSLQQSQAYTTVLTERAAKLGDKYGVAADAVKELQRNLSDATGKAVMLNNADAEKFLQMNKLVGSNVTKQFTSEMMNHLGGQIHAVEGAVSKAYATAAKSGLNAAQFSEKVAKNLSLANKLSFRDGVNGIIKMTALSEKLGFNLQSIEQAANNFMEIDKAIENAAHLQMLGGAAGAYGSNPLTMAYEANYDLEAFTERMTKTLGGYATFDVKTGMANVNGMNRDFVKNIAQAMGISMDEAMSIAKKQAEIKYKESSGLAAKVRALNLSDEQKDYLINASYIGKDGKLKMTDENGIEKDVSGFTQNELNKMMSLNNKSDEEIMEQQALTLTSINEKLEGKENSLIATLAEGVNGSIEKINTLIEEFAPEILKEAQKLAPKIGNAIDEFVGFIRKHGDEFAEGIVKIGNFLGFIYDHWAIFLGAFLGVHFISWFAKFSGILGSGFEILKNIFGATTRTARAAATGIKGLFSKGGSKATVIDIRTGEEAASKSGGVLSRISNFFKGLKNSSFMTKLSEIIGKFSTACKSLTTSISTAATRIGTITTRFSRFVGGIIYDISEALGGILKFLGTKGGSAAFASVTSLGFSGVELNDVKRQMEELDKSFKAGKISQDEYTKELKELRNQKNEALGAGAGGAALGAIGSEFGPWVAIIGAIIGEYIGRWIGKAWNSIANPITEFWNGPLREGMKKAFGTVISNTIINSVGSLVDGITNGYGVILENIVSGFGDIFEGAWEGIKTSIVGSWDGLMKILHGDFSGFIDILESEINGFFKAVNATVSGIWKAFQAPFLGGWELLKGIANSAVDVWDGIIAGGIRLVQLGKTARDNIIEAYSSSSQYIKDTWNEYVVAPWNSITTSFKNGLDSILGFFRDIRNGAKAIWNKISNFSFNDLKEWALSSIPGHAEGGIIEGDSYTGDRVITRVNSGEMVLTKEHQKFLFKFISNIPTNTLTNNNDVKAKPVGEREYIYTPTNNNKGNGVTEVTVKDINLNINGTLKLDAGNFIKNIDINQLLNDSSFISSLKELIKNSINNDMNGGRFLNDNATLRGSLGTTTYWGRYI